jgi:hypothetical protein
MPWTTIFATSPRQRGRRSPDTTWPSTVDPSKTRSRSLPDPRRTYASSSMAPAATRRRIDRSRAAKPDLAIDDRRSISPASSPAPRMAAGTRGRRSSPSRSRSLPATTWTRSARIDSRRAIRASISAILAVARSCSSPVARRCADRSNISWISARVKPRRCAALMTRTLRTSLASYSR